MDKNKPKKGFPCHSDAKTKWWLPFFSPPSVLGRVVSESVPILACIQADNMPRRHRHVRLGGLAWWKGHMERCSVQYATEPITDASRQGSGITQ